MGFANERLKTRTLFVTLPATPASTSTAKQQRRQNKFIGRARVIKFIKQDLNYNVSLLFFLLLLYSLCINWRGATRYLNILILVLILALMYSYRWDFSLVIYCAFVGQGWQRTCILLQRTKQAINKVCLSLCLSVCVPVCPRVAAMNGFNQLSLCTFSCPSNPLSLPTFTANCRRDSCDIFKDADKP